VTILVIGGMTIDDLVLTDGTVHRKTMGGNALYSALGARIWGAPSEIVSFVGADYPDEVLHDLQSRGIGTRYIARRTGGSVRLWILYELDGRRQIQLQHDSATLAPVGAIATESLESMYRAGQRPDVRFSLDTLEARGSVGGDLLDYVHGKERLAPEAFLPSREEFTLLFGDADSPRFRTWKLATATTTLVVKDGSNGSLVSSPPSAAAVRVPALPCDIKDPTGAGDAYCGGYAAGMALRRTPLECAVMGTVAASFAVEGVGIRGLLDVREHEVDRRHELLRVAVERGSG
jgi:sugar/nucleoside kinase (ribokinase family)